jgi:rubrerythrin
VEDELRQRIETQVTHGGGAYVRNLALAEAAVMRGQFNLAKVLRAIAHSQRVQAMMAARLLARADDPAAVLGSIMAELEEQSVVGPEAVGMPVPRVDGSAKARARARELVRRSIASLESHRDVTESEVAQFIFACYGCGNLVETTGEAPEVCDLCGALSPEFARFGPFYSTSAEHLGQRSPAEIVAILATIPDDVAQAVAGSADATLSRKPAADEWCVKEIVAHLLETELLFTRRVNAILTHDGPGLAPINTPVPPWKLHEGKGYPDMPIETILQRLRATRMATVSLVGAITPEQWARRGSNVEGATSVLDLGTWLANHDLGHLVQIRHLCTVT